MCSAKEIIAGLRAIASELDEPDVNDGHDIPGGHKSHPWSVSICAAADYIERMAPPTDGPEFETAAEERAEWQADVNDRLDPRLDCNDLGRLLADVTMAIASRADGLRRIDGLTRLCEERTAERDREAAARREAEAREAALRAALGEIANTTLSKRAEPDEHGNRRGVAYDQGWAAEYFQGIARFALATTSTGEKK